jgi:uncharacterized membrane protein YphA (DoxX/SURF4 family)
MNETNNSKSTYGIYLAWLFLKIAYGFIVLIAGFDKFFGILSPNNEGVVSHIIKALLPIKIIHFFYAVGVFEIIVGAMILTNFTYWGALALMAWYLIIDINLLSMNSFYLLIMNNLGHACAAFTLAQLTKFLKK